MGVSFNDPRTCPTQRGQVMDRKLAAAMSEIGELHDLCRQGCLYEVEEWIRAGNPLQLDPAAVSKGRRIRSALEIGLKAGNHSLCQLLLCNGYRIDVEPDSPLNLALQARRWDLVDLLLSWGADPLCLPKVCHEARMKAARRKGVS